MPAEERDPAPASPTQASAQQPLEAAQNGAAAALTITLAYETGWQEVYLHHAVEGRGVLTTSGWGVSFERKTWPLSCSVDIGTAHA